jgi:hypothetical protein
VRREPRDWYDGERCWYTLSTSLSLGVGRSRIQKPEVCRDNWDAEGMKNPSSWRQKQQSDSARGQGGRRENGELSGLRLDWRLPELEEKIEWS